MIDAVEALNGRLSRRAASLAAGRDRRGERSPARVPDTRDSGSKKNNSDEEAELDEGLKGSFPASDPVSVTVPTRPGRPDRQ